MKYKYSLCSIGCIAMNAVIFFTFAACLIALVQGNAFDYFSEGLTIGADCDPIIDTRSGSVNTRIGSADIFDTVQDCAEECLLRRDRCSSK